LAETDATSARRVVQALAEYAAEEALMPSAFLALCLFSVPVITSGQQTGAAEQQPQAWGPATIEWQEIYPDGTRYSLLEGRRDVPGQAFTYAFFMPAGYWEHHWHTADARVAVVAGELRVAYGDRLDKVNAKGYPVGSYILVPKNVQHTMGANVDTIIVGTAVGPWATHRHHEHSDPKH
jgi:quercetin dioxygenase-like cupin family protein